VIRVITWANAGERVGYMINGSMGYYHLSNDNLGSGAPFIYLLRYNGVL